MLDETITVNKQYNAALDTIIKLFRENAELKASDARLRDALGASTAELRDRLGDHDVLVIAGYGALAETPAAASLEAIRAKERTAIEEIAREISNQYEMESTPAVAIEQLVNAIRARGAK